MKLFFCFILLFGFTMSLNAQIYKANVGINGLTCSQCSRSVQKQIEKLDFVNHIKMDLEETIAYIEFKKGRHISFEAISDAVNKAGFSVRNINLFYTHDKSDWTIKDNMLCKKDMCIKFNTTLPNDISKLSFRLLGKQFNSDKKENAMMEMGKEMSGNKLQYYALLLKD